MPAVILSYASAFKQSLNIAEAVVDFASYFHRNEYTCLGPIVERSMAHAKLLHHLGFGEKFLYGIVERFQ